jgi:hypothetical protein
MMSLSRSSVHRQFETTRWSVVPAARTGYSAESRSALSWLCEACYSLNTFIRLQGYDAEDARDP